MSLSNYGLGLGHGNGVYALDEQNVYMGTVV